MNCLTHCACCAGCRPRYQRLVDNIYPANPNDGLVSANMQKLTFYAISHSEKLDRIGEYLAYRLGRDVYRERIAYVKVTVEAMDRLLSACHGSPSLNLFVESFLKMVQRLLETANVEQQILATDSFVSFSNIQEDTPSYHRRYDFFISKFSELCHSNVSPLAVRRKLRVAGLKGLRGVIRKTVSDDLQANIWEQSHMDKIVPSLLFNMHDDLPIDALVDSENTEEVPKLLADSCLRELTGKASYGNMKSVLLPLQNHFDGHKLWVPHTFAVACFKLIMYSIQSQYSYVVIQSLMSHLDKHMQADARIRCGMATVLSEIVVIAANASIGPSLLEIFNSVLRHLRYSVEHEFKKGTSSLSQGEKCYQETLINTMGEFANNLPDYQKVEIMLFIIGKVPTNTKEKRSDTILQHVLVRTLLKVATKYRTGHLTVVLTTNFLEQLLQLALVDDKSVRLLVQRILHTLLDRHENLKALEHIDNLPDISFLSLTVEKCSRADSMFMKKNGTQITSALFKSAQKSNNDKDNYDAILCTMLLLCVEVGIEDTLVELFRLALGLQSFASDFDRDDLMPSQRAAIHNIVAKYLHIVSQLIAIPTLCQHVQGVITARAELMPPLNLHLEGGPMMARNTDDVIFAEGCAFDKTIMAESISSQGYDATRLNMPLTARPTIESLRNARSTGDEQSVSMGSVEIDSLGSTPETSRRMSRKYLDRDGGGESEITFETLKQIASLPVEKFRQEEAEKVRKQAEMFRTLPYEELRRNRESAHDISAALTRILERVKEREKLYQTQQRNTNAYEIQFPDLFVY